MEKQRLHAKTELSNFAEKMLRQTPEYETARCGGEDHEPLFCSSVRVGDVWYKGEVRHSRKEAETSAAAYALETLCQRKRSTVLLIDCDWDILAELLPALKPEVLEMIDVYLFTTTFTKLPKRLHSGIEVVCNASPSMTLFAYMGYFMGSGAYERYCVGSRSIQMPSHLAAWEHSDLGQKAWPAGGFRLITKQQDLTHELYGEI